MSIYETSLSVGRPSHLGSGQWILRGLNDVTVLFGRTGAGKSQLLRTLRDANHAQYHYVSPERAGELSHDAGVSLEEQVPGNRASRRRANLASSFRQEAVSRLQGMLARLGLIAGNEGRVAFPLSVFQEALSRLLPEFRIKIGVNPPLEFFRQEPGGGEHPSSSVNNLSSGEAEIIALSLDVLSICKIWELENQSKRILLLDEPDTHLHPDLQQRLGRFLAELAESEKVQLIIATHSTTLLAALGAYGGEHTSVIYLDNSQEDQLARPFDDYTAELATCLGGHALMGPLFAAPLLLVEGDDDFQIWSQVPRHHLVKVAVIPCNGGEIYRYQKTLERIFQSLISSQTEPRGFALIDGDASKPTLNGTPQDHIRFVQLNCHEAENLYLTDEVLAGLGLTWELAKERIRARASEFGQKSAALLAAADLDRRQGDFKETIKQIAQILDVKGVPWTMRVAKTIGLARPTGQLADSLGSELILALWGAGAQPVDPSVSPEPSPTVPA